MCITHAVGKETCVRAAVCWSGRGWLGPTAQPKSRRKCKRISVDLGEDVGRKEWALCWGRAETEQRQDPGGAAYEACQNLSSHLPKCVPDFICKAGLGGRLRPSPSRRQRYPPSELRGCFWEGELREALVGGVRTAGGSWEETPVGLACTT